MESPTEHKTPIDQRWFNFIKVGLKKVEGRVKKTLFSTVKVGDIIIWTAGKDEIRTKITRLTIYKTFEDYIINEGLRNTLPEVTTLKDGLAVYYTYYTKAQENEFGVLAVEVQI